MGKFNESKDSESRVRKPYNYISANKLLWTVSYTYVGNVNMHLQQEALMEKCSVNKGVPQKAVMHCTAIFLW